MTMSLVLFFGQLFAATGSVSGSGSAVPVL
jgi:hypothetical protein